MVKLKNLINEEETFKLKKKDGGNIVVFKNKDNYEKALKSGEYIDPINKGDDSLGGKDDEKGSTATASDFDIDKRLGKDKDSDDSDPSYGKWDDMEDRMFSPDDFDSWLEDSDIKLSKDDDQKIMDLMSNWYDLDGDLQQAEMEFEMGDDEDGDAEYQMDMIKDELDITKADIRRIMMKYQDEAEKDKDSDDGMSMSSEEGIKNDLDQLRDKIKVRGDKQIQNGEVFRQLAQDVEDEYGEEAGIKSVEDLRYISYDIASQGIENTEEMLKKVLDNLELELQRYNSDQLRDKIKVRGDKQIQNGEVFRQLAQDVEDEYGEEAGIKSVEDLRYISYDIASQGIENTEEMLKKVLDNLELELQRYNSDVFQSVPGRDPKESYQTIKEQFNRIKRK